MLLDDAIDLEHGGEPADAASAEPRSNELFVGRYSVIQTIGVGGMGKVFEVYDTRIGRTLALKLMRGRARSRPSLVQRFHREYRAMSRLQHPGVPNIFDAGLDELGRPYFTMDLVRGEPLLDTEDVARTPIERLALIREAAQILVRIHEAGIIHRDIKPSNILIDGTGRPHLIDFGACSLAEELEAEHPAAPAPHIRTAPGTWLGTLGYIDPAMLEGAPCSVRSDIYSLAATLSWLFTRQHPSPDVLAALPRTGIEAVDALLRRGMARDPDERPATAAAFVAELAAAEAMLEPPDISRVPTPVERVPSRSFSPALILALGVLGGALAGPIQSAATNSHEAPPPQRVPPHMMSLPPERPASSVSSSRPASPPAKISTSFVSPPATSISEVRLEARDATDSSSQEAPQPPTVAAVATPRHISAPAPARARVKKPTARHRRGDVPEKREIARPPRGEEITPQSIAKITSSLQGCYTYASESPIAIPVTVTIVGKGWKPEKLPRESPYRRLAECITARLDLYAFVGFPNGYKLTLRDRREAQ